MLDTSFPKVAYDSLENVITDEKKLGGYIGQQLVLIDYKRINFRSSSYSFYKEKNGGIGKKIQFPKPYTKLLVLDIFKPTEQQPDEYGLANFCMKLRDQTTGETLFLSVLDSHYIKITFPFIVTGHFEKLKQKIGEKYRLKYSENDKTQSTAYLLNWENGRKIFDYKTGKRILFADTDVLIISDVNINENEQKIVIIISKNGENYFVMEEEVFDKFNGSWIVSEKVFAENQEEIRKRKESDDKLMSKISESHKDKMEQITKNQIGKNLYIHKEQKRFSDFLLYDITNRSNNQKIEYKFGEKYNVIGLETNDNKIFCVLESLKYGKVLLDEKDFAEKLLIVAESEEEHEKRLLRLKEVRLKVGEDIWSYFTKNIPKIGMNTEMCIMILGYPDDINSTETMNKLRSQWVYKSHDVRLVKDKYFYFENGILTTIQD